MGSIVHKPFGPHRKTMIWATTLPSVIEREQRYDLQRPDRGTDYRKREQATLKGCLHIVIVGTGHPSVKNSSALSSVAVSKSPNKPDQVDQLAARPGRRLDLAIHPLCND